MPKHDESKGRPIPQVETGTGRHRTDADHGSLPSGARLGGADQTPAHPAENPDGTGNPWS